ncbi:ufm1-specific protease 2-like [Tubulanus polymorphus]|uniref:ufm1-specific protease 2-like n=1 Tax=Tubulanus polymorphus TaxID=672921 RepID=UPI003DA52D2C
MAAPIKLTAAVVKRLEDGLKNGDGSQKAIGFLLGHWTEDCLTVTGCYRCLHSTVEAIQHNLQEVSGHIPVGSKVCGIFFLRPNEMDVNTALRDIRLAIARGTKTVQGHSWPDHIFTMILQNEDDNSVSIEEMFWYHLDNRDATEADVEIVNSPVTSDFITMRVQGTIPFLVEHSKSKDSVMRRIANQLQLLIDSITAGTQTVFRINNSNILFHAGGVVSAEVHSGTACADLCDYIIIEEDNDGFEIVRKKKKDRKKEVIYVSMLERFSAENDMGVVPSHTPIINQDQASKKMFSVNLPLDVICSIPSEEPLGNLASELIMGVTDQLASMGRCMCQFYNGEIRKPVVHHFQPWSDGQFLTVVYPDTSEDDDQLENYRKMLHEKFLLPLDRPMLRRGNRCRFRVGSYSDGLLRNPHVGLNSPSSGEDYLVYGLYAYHHYMQDRIDDNGWGCAYRSLQTLISWFNHQGYTNISIPTHQEIQSALVDMKDKEPSFVGTKRWIGSTEVSYCLDYFLDVVSKIMFVSSGAELANKGRELAQHFQTQGTPIMIGGGVYAHTILGVNYNSVTGDLKFLILDPHYTGSEDIKVIQTKGWCGWKGVDFWNQQAYYNLCMPQRPIVI